MPASKAVLASLLEPLSAAATASSTQPRSTTPGRSIPSVRRTVVHILSTNYAGSHFLSLMLGSHSRSRHLGEVHRLRNAHSVPLERLCYACRERGSCPVFSGIAPDQVDRVYQLLFKRMDPNVTALIDASKTAHGWLERFLGDDSYDHKYIHLIRDPRALVRRWLQSRPGWPKSLRRRWRMMCAYPRQAPQLALAPATRILTYQWLRQNQRISRLVEEHRLDAQLVTYHDLALDPAGELQRLMPWLGLAYEPDQLEYWKFQHHGSQKASYQWVKDAPARHFDLRWQKDLAPEVQEQVIGNPEIRRYLDGLGIVVGADGLARIPVLGR
ncbi:hypothetical protein AYO40_00315 [Planctomycetaceae bacterium SCGC AG-212-D15]|nr:hypothetical protein AYO40_00315 [Planctomycetaceae bacterium SCGC AG-212-D15]